MPPIDETVLKAPDDDFPPSIFYETIGRIAVGAALLEGHLALSAVWIAGRPAAEPDPSNPLRSQDAFDDPAVHAALADPGGAMRAFRRAVALVVDQEMRTELEAVADEVRAALDERNRVVHSVLRWRLPEAAYAGEMHLLAFHPRSRIWSPLFRKEMSDLDKRLLRLSHRVIQAGNRGHSDWFRRRRGESEEGL